MQVSELPALIVSVHATLAELRNGAPTEPAGPEKPTAAQIKNSLSRDGIVSFEEGKTYKTLKRHLTLRSLNPETCRAKYGLPADYPMTAPSYSAQRSALALALGLGQQRRKAATKAEEAPVAAPKARGRKKAAETA